MILVPKTPTYGLWKNTFMLEILTFPVLPTKDSYFLKGVALFLLALRVSECGMWHLPYDGYIVLEQQKKRIYQHQSISLSVIRSPL